MSFSSRESGPDILSLSSAQAVTRAVSTIKFLRSEAFLGQHFETLELKGREPEPGDLFLFRLISPTGYLCGAHLGVHCGHREIIHFEGKTPGGHGPHMLLGSCEGLVSKQGRRLLLRSDQLWHVLRRRSGVDHRALECRMRQAMDADQSPYHPTRSNCVHFALYLLDLGPSLDTLQTDPSPISLVSYPLRTSPACRAC